MSHILEFRDNAHLLDKLYAMKEDICEVIEALEGNEEGEYNERRNYRERGNYRNGYRESYRNRSEMRGGRYDY